MNQLLEQDADHELTQASIVVEISQAYGRELIKPVDERAKAFCSLMGQTTLTRENIKSIQLLGFSVGVRVIGGTIVRGVL